MLNQVIQQCLHTYIKKNKIFRPQNVQTARLPIHSNHQEEGTKKICVRRLMLVAMLAEEMLPLSYSSTVYSSQDLSSLFSNSFVFNDHEKYIKCLLGDVARQHFASPELLRCL